MLLLLLVLVSDACLGSHVVIVCSSNTRDLVNFQIPPPHRKIHTPNKLPNAHGPGVGSGQGQPIHMFKIMLLVLYSWMHFAVVMF